MNKDPKQEVEEELRFHLEQRTRDYMARGMSPEAARQAAGDGSATPRGYARRAPPCCRRRARLTSGARS